MKKLGFVILLNILFALAYGEKVDPETARAVATRFIQTLPGRMKYADQISLDLIYTARKASADKLVDQRTYFYVFNLRNARGFLIIAADDHVFPVLAYSYENNFNAAHLPAHVATWMKGYEHEIESAATQIAKPTPGVTESWRKLKNKLTRDSVAVQRTSVAPLLTTRWNQSPFYNAYCPGQSVTGCVATSMAQVMKYWNHPVQGNGTSQYTHQRFGRLKANFEMSGYDWKAMPDSINMVNHEVAALMYDCGISVNMDFSPETSNAYLIASTNPVSAENALKKYFNYSKEAKGIKLEDYSYATWLSVIKSELNAKRPVLYAGFGNGGGHCFITDGYEQDYFHFNWGWGGAYDGYFLLSALNPSGVGIGGGSGNYNKGHQALIGVQPEVSQPEVESFDLGFHGKPALVDSVINYGEAISVSTQLVNKGANDFAGDFCAAVFDENNMFCEYLEIKTGSELKTGTLNTRLLSFTSNGMLSMVAGVYNVRFFYRSRGGTWKLLPGSDSSLPQLSITVLKSNVIELTSKPTNRNANKWIHGAPVSVELDLLNRGSSIFKGEYRLAIYNFDGKAVQIIHVIEEQNGLPPGGSYAPQPLLFHNERITVVAGTYLLAVSFREAGTEEWKFAGGGSFENPVMIIVAPPAVTADRYEYNNIAGSASPLPVLFVEDKTVFKTDVASIHQPGDEDYYKVTLPSGFDYTIKAKLNDVHSSTGEADYTLDGVFEVGEDTVNWSATYDEEMKAMHVEGGKTVYFHVSPYFPGQAGSYMLEIEITRKNLLTAAVENGKEINIYPNPVKARLFIDLRQYKGSVKSVTLHTLSGKKVYGHVVSGVATQLTIPVENLTAGIYIVTFQTGQGRSSRKILVTK